MTFGIILFFFDSTLSTWTGIQATKDRPVSVSYTHLDVYKRQDPIDLGVPFLAFYGDWTKAPIMDSTDYWETLDGSASQAQAYICLLYTSHLRREDHQLYGSWHPAH